MTEQRTPAETRQQRSTAMVVLGSLLLVFGAVLAVYGTGGGPGALIFAVLGAGLIVGGLVIRR